MHERLCHKQDRNEYINQYNNFYIMLINKQTINYLVIQSYIGSNISSTFIHSFLDTYYYNTHCIVVYLSATDNHFSFNQVKDFASYLCRDFYIDLCIYPYMVSGIVIPPSTFIKLFFINCIYKSSS